MKNNSRIRFNPGTKEIEIEGTEKFVKAYFGKIQAMISGLAEKKVTAAKARPPKKGRKTTKKESGEKRVTNIDTVVRFIQASTEGISTAELKEKTGLAESQIWDIVNRASKTGKIRKMRRGVYAAVAAVRA